MRDQTQFPLDDSRLPRAWYNINADLPVALSPPLHPQTRQPVTPEFLSDFVILELMAQDMSRERHIEIPEPVRDIYKLWRPTQLSRARRLEQALQTPAHIYYKYEGSRPGRLAQTEYRSRPSLLRQAGRRADPDDRNRSRPVGLGPGHGLHLLRPRL